jgi:serine/threonine-protein kinase
VVVSAAQHGDKLPPFTDKYDVERVIGRGGMGTVFEARHTRLGQRVAIKVLGEDLRAYPELVRRFEREARAASALSSPHAVRVFDIDTTEDGTPFFVMELLSGRDLSDIVASDGPQRVGVAVRWVIEACDAIAEAHRLGIVHRDIKPSNLLLCETGSIKVLDFGIAKSEAPNERAITLGVQPLGTPQYMSPEQVRCAKDVDARTDIWSLGVTLYELVTGRPPFNHDLSAACIASIAADPVPDPRDFKADLPEDFVKVIMRALEKDPKKRYQTVDELVLALAPFGEAMTPETASWRVISTIRKAHTPTSSRDSTLGDEPKPLAPYEPEDTVPPATIIHVAIPHGKRLHGALALAAASVLGFAAFVLTPQWMSSSLDAQQRSAAAATVLVQEAAPPAPSASAPVAAPEEAPPAASATIELPATPAPSASASGPALRDLAKAPPARPHTTVRFVGSERPVHGGISNPGF